MADGFDTIPCEPNKSDCQEVSQYTFDTQIGSAYNVSRAIAEQWQVIEKLKQDVGEVADKTAVKDYNDNIFKNLTLKGENGVNVDINEDNPEQLDISLDQDITNQIDINTENIALLENNLDDTTNNLSALETRVTDTEEIITELAPDVARALKTPMSAPWVTKLVGVDTTNSQEMLQLSDSDFYIDDGVIRLKNIFLEAYPIGSIYISIQNVSPASYIGGTWEQLPANYALWTATSGAGETISAGLPNITGKVEYRNPGNTDDALFNENSEEGAFEVNLRNSSTQWSGGLVVEVGPNKLSSLLFDASKSNSLYGGSSTVQPPAYKIYAWKRTA